MLALLLTASVVAASLALYGGVLPSDRHKVATFALGAVAVWPAWLSLRRPGRDAGRAGVGAAGAAVAGGVDLVAVAWVAGLGCLALVSAWWSIDRGASLWEGALLLGSPAAFLAGASLPGPGAHPRGSATRARRACKPRCVIAAGSLIGFAVRSGRWIQVQDQAVLLSGPFGYANAMAALMLMTIPSTLGCLARPPAGVARAPRAGHTSGVASTLGATDRGLSGNTVRRAVLWSGLAAQLTALTLTASRAAMGIAVVLLILGVTLPHRARLRQAARRVREQRGGRVLIALCVMIGSAAAAFVLWRAGSNAAGLVQNLHSKTVAADQNRLQIWHAAVGAAGRRPVLGYGSDTFFSAYMPFPHTLERTGALRAQSRSCSSGWNSVRRAWRR